jgi:Ca2+-binding RTX toxin-like protein
MNSAPLIESLESRRLFAGIIFSGHILRVIGNITPNIETVGLTPDGQSVEVTLRFSTPRGTHYFSKLVPLSQKIILVSLVGGNGADYLTVDQTNGLFNIRCNMFGGNGNDTLVGGNEADSLDGCLGNDSLVGGDGNDTIYGSRGNDTIYGNAGNDYLNGGLGHDYIEGDDGNDTLADAFGPDTLYGGAGNNLFIGSVIGPDKTDFDPKRDRVEIVSTAAGTPSTSFLNSLFPIDSLF